MKKKKNIHAHIGFLLAILIVLLCITGFLISITIQRAGRMQFFNSYRSWLDRARHHGPLSAQDVNFVQSWMTFDYVNVLFDLPSDYLKAALHISDPRYPRLSLNQYARSENTTAITILSEVRMAITKYLAPSQ